MSRPVTLTLLMLKLSLTVTGSSFKCTETISLFPPGCTCSNPPANLVPSSDRLKPIIDCSELGLTSVPTLTVVTPYVLYELRLNNNNITSLTDSAFSQILVSAIDLRGNAIASVSNNAFKNLQEPLHTLHLQGDTTNLPRKNAFVHLGDNLKTLTLTDYNMPTLNEVDSEGNYIEPFAVFISLVNLERLTLQRCKLNVIEHEAFFQSSGPINLQELSLLDQDLRSALQAGVRDLTSLMKLTISGNRELTKLTPSVFNTLTSLETLDLSGNGINSIEDNAFSGLSALKTLKLSNNVFQTQHFESISGLTSLETLDLSNNGQITSVPRVQALGKNQKLALDLSHCEISELNINDLSGMADSLDYLDLSYNRISTPSDRAFESTTQLRTLKLAHQQFSVDSLHVPSSLDSVPLVHLDLSGHPVDPVSLWPVVKTLSSLEVLRLSSTDLTSIPDMALEKLKRLRELDLNFNRLTQLNQKTLVGPRYTLEKLFLNGNPFQTLSQCLLHQYKLSKPLEMSLEPNSLTCDCRLRWIPEHTTSNIISFNVEPKCPDGVSLLSKSPQDLGCGSGATTPSCTDHYQDDVSPEPTLRPDLSLRLDEIGQNRLTITWAVQPSPDLQYFKVEISDHSRTVLSKQLDTSEDSFNTPPLADNTFYTVCVTPVYPNSQKPECKSYTITGTGTDPPEALTDDDDDDNVGIIIGAVVAGVVLIALLVAIAYMVFIHRKSKPPPGSSNRHAQPRTYTKSELPDMAKDSVQVVAISDGMTGNGTTSGSTSSGDPARVGRAHLLTSEGSTYYKDMSDLRAPSPYENDRGPLPRAPRDARGPQLTLAATHAYYNEAFNNNYDEIGPREVTV